MHDPRARGLRDCATHVWDVRDLSLAACSWVLALESCGQVSGLSLKKFWESDSTVWRARLTTVCDPRNWDKVIPTGIKLSRTQVEALDLVLEYLNLVTAGYAHSYLLY